MCNFRIFYAFAVFLLVGLMACNQETKQAAEEEQPQNEEATTASSETPETEYVCPMRCKGSGLDDPGTCSVCNMLLVRSVEIEDFDPENSKHTEGSVYNLQANWLTQNGDQIQLEDLSDDYQLVCMIFTTCPEACPNLIGDMLSIDEALEPETKEKLNYLLVTIDPDVDTPERLADYAKLYDLNSDRWTLLQGEKPSTQELADLLGVEYKKYENGTLGHTNYLTLLNKNGEVIYRLHGIHVPNEDLLAYVHEHI